jgi:fatty-acyl-CoA synthase
LAGPFRVWRSKSWTRLPGAVAERGIPGEQCTRGYNVMLGYWNNEAATQAAIDAAGWMHTGDLAVMDDN